MSSSQQQQKQQPALSASSKKRLKKQMESLQDEMEIVEYAKVGFGNKKRRTPRKQMAERTQKRKRLEKNDRDERKKHGGVVNQGQRLRGSKASMNETVLQDSFVFHRDQDQDENDGSESDDENNSDDEDDDEEEVEGDEIEGEHEEIAEGEHEELARGEKEIEDEEPLSVEQGEYEDQKAVEKDEEGDDADDDEEIVDDDDEEIVEDDHDELIAEVEEQAEPAAEIKQPTITAATTKAGKPKLTKLHKRKRGKRNMFRMRNFKSQRMVERHGAALGAHLQGMPQLAIRRLEQLAADAPAAPQVYSSLGMVYEEMLKQNVDNSDWRGQLELAKKAYGSHHVTALLCKKDYMAWVRAGDNARDVADLYSIAMRMEAPDDHRANKLLWVQEAQKDYQTADNLKPPGLDVPAKLASSHMELGNLSEALTILTDLKKQPHQTHKTWMLYADLMLRIGHECTQWNKGDDANQNYMFRRWLRKYSRLFDWQERRLQALALALEAAAGSATCRKFILLTMHRAKDKSKPSTQVVDDSATIYDNSRWHVDAYECQQAEDAMDDEAETLMESGIMPLQRPIKRTLTLSEARGNLLAKNKQELDNFNEASKSLNGSRMDQRLKRDILIKRHRRDLLDLVGAFIQEKKAVEADQARTSDLPIAASCTTVCGIASELIKHCLGLEWFDGGLLVAECASLYLKERSAMREKRLQANMDFERKQRSTASNVLLNREVYDENDDESLSDDDGSPEYLSDDEILTANSALAEHFKKGILPPELQVLYALCLIASGGKDFLASKCIEAIEDLRDDTQDGIEQKLVDTNVICYPSWQVYSQAMTDPLARIPAFSFVADLLQKAKKEEEWASKLLPLFRSELELMRDSGIIGQALTAGNSIDPKIVLRRTQVFKIVLASVRLRVLTLEQLLETTASSLSIEHDAIACYDEIHPDFVLLWSVENFDTRSKSSVEALQIMVRAYRLLEKAGVDPKVRYQKIQQLVPLFVVGADPIGGEVENVKNLPELTSIPFPSSWQSEELRMLSILAHNLCVANCVTNFSGWESEEFNLDLLQRKGRGNYFGITLNDGRVIGHMNQDVVKCVGAVWNVVGAAVGVAIDYAGYLDKAVTFLVKDSHVEPIPTDDEVAMYGEHNALFILTDYAQLCFEMATTLEALSTEKARLIQIGLSLLLPVTQFCLLDRVWDSSIGQATASLSGVGEWRTITGTCVPSSGKGPPRARPVRPLQKKQLRSVGQWHEADLSLLARIVILPVNFILAEWMSDVSPEAKDAAIPDDVITQNTTYQSKLQDAMCHLRSCSTANAVKKASLQVTLALLDLVPLAYNPFLIMQQAAMFASQCAKGGNLDVSFRTELPLPLECTPSLALTILVRADCLQALHFTQEATFLCSFVARTCRMHRDRLQSSDAAKWTCRWKVIGICTHTISMAIRSTICAIHTSKEERVKALQAWDNETLGELERCRADAKVMRRALLGEEEDEDAYETMTNEEDLDEGVIDRTTDITDGAPGNDSSLVREEGTGTEMIAV